jgi:hypothetical protein
VQSRYRHPPQKIGCFLVRNPQPSIPARSAEGFIQKGLMTKRIFISADHGMAIAGLKPHAQFMEALRALVQRVRLADFHELRQGFIPPKPKPEASKILVETESTKN